MSRRAGVPTQDDDELGGRIGAALHRREAAAAPVSFGLDGVRLGARRRLRTRRAFGVAAAAIAVAGVGGALTLGLDRGASPTPATEPVTVPPNPPVQPSLLPAYAMLVGDGDNVVTPGWATASRGGTPSVMPLPAVEVWTHEEETIVVRTVRLNDGPADEQSPATTAAPSTGDPWGDRQVTRITARGATAGVEQLADDQFAVWIPQGSDVRYTLVIGRGMDQARLVEVVDALVERDGVLEPVGFEAVHRAPTANTGAASPIATVGYTITADGSDVASTVWLSTTLATDATSLEAATLRFDVGAIEQLSGREVLVARQPGGWTTLTWLEPNGLVVRMAADASLPLEELVGWVQFVGEPDWSATRRALAQQIVEDLPVQATTALGDVDIELRSNDERVALCLTIRGSKDCAASPQPPDTRNGVALLAEAEIDGDWILAGRSDGPRDGVTIDDMTFRDAAGQPVARPEWLYADGGYWWIARIPSGVDIVETNLGLIVGGPSGWLARPAGMSVST